MVIAHHVLAFEFDELKTNVHRAPNLPTSNQLVLCCRS
jgi:hypothetical protein